ncbi:hypothetical protein EVAR_61388_1 [Eumeta japonica]|uniref:Uncharacterized protein n=1 Tax=Eumeta variegata TaxID=151549 RepID=A0A4C1ZAI9_EUMVA|nr:hypothetical protein EVAR_61388_1 [Eumeta japonica]
MRERMHVLMYRNQLSRNDVEIKICQTSKDNSLASTYQTVPLVNAIIYQVIFNTWLLQLAFRSWLKNKATCADLGGRAARAPSAGRPEPTAVRRGPDKVCNFGALRTEGRSSDPSSA